MILLTPSDNLLILGIKLNAVATRVDIDIRIVILGIFFLYVIKNCLFISTA